MKIKITKGSRQFGYLIWNKKISSDMEKLLENKDSITVVFNGFNIGLKNIDRKYYRISLGYKLTRAMPESHNYYSVTTKNDVLEVKSFHE